MPVEFEVRKQWVDDYLDATTSHRHRADIRRDYTDGVQWTDEEIEEQIERGQPVLTYNYIQEKVGTLVGAEVMGRTAPTCTGRNPGIDQSTAAVMTAAMRYVTDEADWDGERSLGREQLVVEGVTGTEVIVDDRAMAVRKAALMAAPKDRGHQLDAGPGQPGEQGQVPVAAMTQVAMENPQIELKHITYDRLFYDPHSRFDDFRDAKYYGSIIWQDLDDAIADWPDRREMLEQAVELGRSYQGSGTEETHEDKPNHWYASQRTRIRVRISHMWYRHSGEWFFCYMCGSGDLQDPKPSPYKDDRDRSIPGMIIQSSATRRAENERYGPVENMLSPQEDINKRHSRSTYLMNTMQLLAEEGAFRSKEDARQELKRPDGIVEYARGRQVSPLSHQQQVQDNLMMLQVAKEAMGAMGPSDALIGNASAGASGIALQHRQENALLKFGKLLNNASRWELRVYRHIYYRIRQFWTAHDFIRVTEDEEAPSYLEVNKPITVMDVLVSKGMSREEIQMLAQTGQLQMAGIDPVQQVGVMNHLQQLDVDVILERRPSSPTYRQDQINAMADLLGKLPLPEQSAAAAAEIVLEMVDLDPRIKRRLLKTLQPDPESQAAAAQQQAQQAALQQQLTALQLENLQAQTEKTRAEIDKLRAQAETEETAAIENVANANRSMADAASKNAQLATPAPSVDVTGSQA
jgi:hypothetical protein